MNDIESFIKLSKYAGERFDLVQAGGGNTSVKVSPNDMLIKASGYALSEIELDRGYTRVNHHDIQLMLDDKSLLALGDKKKRENSAKNFLKTTYSGTERPSIETFLHALCSKFTLHTHPLVVNMITCQKTWKETLRAFFPKAVLVEYRTPGIDLALALKEELTTFMLERDEFPEALFLQNHGLIITGSTVAEVILKNESILRILEDALKVDIKKYKLVTQVSTLINSIEENYQIAYLSTDEDILTIIRRNKEIIFSKPFCPDKLVYCGNGTLEVFDLKNKDPVLQYAKQNRELPRVIIYKDHLFFIAQNVKKAKEMEDVFKFHLLTLDKVGNDISFLDDLEIAYLSNWEAEKYRQKI